MPDEKWDANKGANPATCLHRVLFADAIANHLQIAVYCVSCGTEITPEFLTYKHYEYNVTNQHWVYTGKCGCS